jgi:hypothetical protein
VQVSVGTVHDPDTLLKREPSATLGTATYPDQLVLGCTKRAEAVEVMLKMARPRTQSLVAVLVIVDKRTLHTCPPGVKRVS